MEKNRRSNINEILRMILSQSIRLTLGIVVHGTWCMVHGAWYMVYGVWYMVHGAWCSEEVFGFVRPDTTGMDMDTGMDKDHSGVTRCDGVPHQADARINPMGRSFRA